MFTGTHLGTHLPITRMGQALAKHSSMKFLPNPGVHSLEASNCTLKDIVMGSSREGYYIISSGIAGKGRNQGGMTGDGFNLDSEDGTGSSKYLHEHQMNLSQIVLLSHKIRKTVLGMHDRGEK